jgi:hypothetical protein
MSEIRPDPGELQAIGANHSWCAGGLGKSAAIT